MPYLELIAGLVVLVISGELLVKGAVATALKMKVSTLVIGMTVVSLGTSAPELLVSVKAAISGHPDISMGNVIGSNIANLALVLGFTALIFPIPVGRKSIRVHWPVMMGCTVLLYILILDQWLSMVEGIIFLLLLVGFNFMLIRASRREHFSNENNDATEEINQNKMHIATAILLLVLGCVGLVFGAEWLLNGSIEIAREFDISERVIGITIVAFGTSVPELATSCVAAFRKEPDISVGNLIGSNIFNILAILGVTSVVKNIPVSQEMIDYDMIWVGGISLIIFPIILIGRKVTRFRGVLLFLIYVVYIYSLF